MSLHTRIAGCFTCVLLVVAAPGVRAQNDGPKNAAPRVTRLVTLGTGAGPRITPNRSQPANVIVVKGRPYLFDAGNGVLRQLVLAGVPYLDVRDIFLTHLHDDHTADVGTVFGMQWDIPGQGHPLDVFGPVGTKDVVKGFLQFFARNAEIRESDLDAPAAQRSALYADPNSALIGHDIQGDGLVYQDGNIKVYAAENSHYHFRPESPAYGRDKSYAYRVETPDRVIVFTGDTGPSEAVRKLAKGADILVSEIIDVNLIENAIFKTLKSTAGNEAMKFHMEREHLNSEEVGKMAAAAGVRLVVLSHIAPGRPTDPDSLYTAGVRKFFKGKVILAKDLMSF